MTAALEALSGVSVTSANSDRLELQLTTHVAGDHLGESGCGPCMPCWLYINAAFTQGNIMFWLQKTHSQDDLYSSRHNHC